MRMRICISCHAAPAQRRPTSAAGRPVKRDDRAIAYSELVCWRRSLAVESGPSGFGNTAFVSSLLKYFNKAMLPLPRSDEVGRPAAHAFISRA